MNSLVYLGDNGLVGRPARRPRAAFRAKGGKRPGGRAFLPGNPRHPGGQLFAPRARGRLAFHVGARGQDDLYWTGRLAESIEQFANPQVIGPDAIEWRKHAVEHMVAAAKAGSLHREQIGWMRDHAKQARIATAVLAERA